MHMCMILAYDSFQNMNIFRITYLNDKFSASLLNISFWLFMDSRLVRIFYANSPSQKARGSSYNLLLLLRKDCLFCHRSECYEPPSPSISLESIKSLPFNTG